MVQAAHDHRPAGRQKRLRVQVLLPVHTRSQPLSWPSAEQRAGLHMMADAGELAARGGGWEGGWAWPMSDGGAEGVGGVPVRAGGGVNVRCDGEGREPAARCGTLKRREKS